MGRGNFYGVVTEGLFGIRRGKKLRNIAVAFDDVDDLKPVVVVLEKDHIVFKRDATKIGTQIRSFLSHCEWQGSEVVAVSANAEDELAGNISTST